MKYVRDISPYLLFSFFFGLSFVIVEDLGADSLRYAQELKELYDSQSNFADYFALVYKNDTNKVDLYQPLVTFVVSRFTGDYQWLFSVYAIVFGYFWFKSIMLIRVILPNRLNLFLTLSLLFFAFLNPIWQINGVRMWTAVQVFIYGLLLLYFRYNIKGNVFLFLSIFIHFSLLFPLFIYLIYKFLPFKNIRIYYLFYLITYIGIQISPELLRNNFGYLPSFLLVKEAYLSEEYAESVNESSNFLPIYIQLYYFLSKWVIFLIISIIFYKINTLKKTTPKSFVNLVSLTLLFCSFSNLASKIPSGSRFFVISDSLVIISFIISISVFNHFLISKYLKSTISLLFSFIILVKLRLGADFVSPLFFIGNPIVNIISEEKISLLSYFKNL